MNSKEWVEITAPTVEEATILGLTRLGITREEASIEVIDEGSKGFLGFGMREAQVRVSHRPLESTPAVTEKTPPSPTTKPEAAPKPATSPQTSAATDPSRSEAKPAPVRQPEPQASPPTTEKHVAKAKPKPHPKPKPKPQPVAQKPQTKSRQRLAEAESQSDDGLDRPKIEAVVQEVAEHLFDDLDVQYKLVWREEDRPTLWLSLRGKDADALVGRRGRTLHAVQYLLRALVRKQISGNFNLVVDSDGYRRRRYRSLKRLARRMAEKAVESGHSVRLRPMNANERRIVHMTLRRDTRVRTKSSGSGRSRAVNVIPNNK